MWMADFKSQWAAVYYILLFIITSFSVPSATSEAVPNQKIIESMLCHHRHIKPNRKRPWIFPIIQSCICA